MKITNFSKVMNSEFQPVFKIELQIDPELFEDALMCGVDDEEMKLLLGTGLLQQMLVHSNALKA